MLFIHITLYASMLTLGFVVGVIFPEMPWVPLWLFTTFAVLGYRIAQTNRQRAMAHLVETHKDRLHQILNNTGE
jgi:uncharacterized membrane protein AbrB (regulator of aidB expression)